MLADADIQVWLDTQITASQTLIVPYVQSATDKRLHYQISLIQRAGGNSSHVSQQGNVALNAGKAATLSRLSVNPAKNGTCELQVVLSDQETEVGRFSFDCAAEH